MSHRLSLLAALIAGPYLSAQAVEATAATESVFHEPERLQADGAPIDIGLLSKYAHAGPCLADVDADGDRDLVVGDFPGYFWLFLNTGTDAEPVYAGKDKLQAGGEAAKTPVY